MTTAPPRDQGPGPAGATAVRLPVLGTLAAAVLLVLAGALLGGVPAASGAAVGSTLVLGAFALGALALGAVARIAPTASLLVALLTYTLTVVVLALVFAALSQSDALDVTLSREWLAGAVIGCTVVWLTAQIVAAVRSRQPLYDLPAEGPGEGPAEGPGHGTEASVR